MNAISVKLIYGEILMNNKQLIRMPDIEHVHFFYENMKNTNLKFRLACTQYRGHKQ